MPAGFSGGSWPTAGGMGRTSELFQNGPNRKNRAKAKMLIQLDPDTRKPENQTNREHANQGQPASHGNPQLLVACGIGRASDRMSGKAYGMEVF